MSPVKVCPECHGALDDAERCAQCQPALVYAPSPLLGQASRSSVSRTKWHQSPEGRLVIGVMLALGLCYGFLQCGMAVLRGLGREAPSGALSPLAGLVLFQGLQALALLPAGALAGAGQRRGALLGAATGLFSGLFFISGMLTGVLSSLVQSFSEQLLKPGTPIHDLTLYSLPVIHTFFGTVGGLAGSLVWRAPVEVTLPFLSPKKQLALRREATSSRPLFRWEGPIAWGHVLVGTVVAIAGAVNTPTIVDFILRASDDQLKIMTQLEDAVAYGEIFALSILAGGCLAGAHSPNGLKQGVCVGMTLAFLMAGIFYKGPNAPSVVYPVLCALCLAPVGGWFGSELLPPTVQGRGRRRSSLY